MLSLLLLLLLLLCVCVCVCVCVCLCVCVCVRVSCNRPLSCNLPLLLDGGAELKYSFQNVKLVESVADTITLALVFRWNVALTSPA